MASIKLLADIEGVTAEELVTRLEQSPKIISACDLFTPGVLHPSLSLPQPAAVVIIKLCLEFALTSSLDLAPSLARVTAIMAPGGLLVIMGALGNVVHPDT